MLSEFEAHSGFSVDDADRAARSYGDMLGQPVTDLDPEFGMFRVGVGGGRRDERGIAHGMGPDIAWFADPAGNVIAVHQA